MSQQQINLNIQLLVPVLKAVKNHMLEMASAITSDEDTLRDLGDVIDEINQSFIVEHNELRLEILKIDEYATMNFKDISCDLRKNAELEKARMGFIQRAFYFIPLMYAEKRILKLIRLSESVLEENPQKSLC